MRSRTATACADARVGRRWPAICAPSGSSTFLALLVVLLPACNDSSPAAPTPAIPDVAGTYSGPLVLTVAVDPDNTQTLNGTMRLVVTQSGSQVTLNGTITIFGATDELPPTVGMIPVDRLQVSTHPA